MAFDVKFYLPADGNGDDALNLDLSKRCAASVKNFCLPVLE